MLELIPIIRLFLLLTIVILIGIWNGLVINWYLTKDQNYSKQWHTVGFWVRGLLVATIALSLNLFYIWIGIILAWHVYDIIINLLMGQKWYYIGSTSTIDKMGKIMWIAKAAILLFGIYFLI